MTKVKVPKEVSRAFDFYELKLNPMKRDTKRFILMSLPFSAVNCGPGRILKKYAFSNPSQYLQSLLYGYEPQVDVNDVLVDMIEEWLNKPYYGSDEKEDVKVLVSKITKHLQKQK